MRLWKALDSDWHPSFIFLLACLSHEVTVAGVGVGTDGATGEGPYSCFASSSYEKSHPDSSGMAFAISLSSS